MSETATLQLSSVVEQVRRYGGGVSHAALDPSCSHFRVPGIEGLIGFQTIHGCAVVYGDPLCASEQQGRLADAFAAHCEAKDWSILYTAATATMQAYGRERGYGTIEFADLLMADPQQDPERGHEARHLRQNLNHTRRLEVKVQEYRADTSPDILLENQAEAACKHWQTSRHGPQMHLGNPRLFADRQGRRWFIAERSGTVLGVLSMLEVSCGECHSMINLVFSTPAAPHHTNDLMVVTALKALREEGARSVCFGIGPRWELGRIDGFGGISEFLARRLYRLAASMMHLSGKCVFWEKYGVIRREPLYLLFRPPHIGIRELNALARSFHFSMS
ncbi:MAG: phosphatidylglycerol lysyltransferase domain-containing protein [Methylococcaceae bacterium]|nr:phosphatidylglycerol lysyltransferase domain-containing protein [Methylococcaceae bacterium]